MRTIRNAYRVLRSIALVAVIAVASLYVLLYVALAVPAVQNGIRKIAERELSKFLDGSVKIGRLDIVPFSELRLYDVTIAPHEKETPALSVARLGAGINMGALIIAQRIEITYAEISGLKAEIIQREKDGPLNIDFIIKALSPKEKNKPPTKFDLRLRKVAIRNGCASFVREWCPAKADGKLDFNRLRLDSLTADIRIPRLSNDIIAANITRLAFLVEPGISVRNLQLNIEYTPNYLAIDDLRLQMPGTDINIPYLKLPYSDKSQIAESLKESQLELSVPKAIITPSDFASLLPDLRQYDSKVEIILNAKGNINRIESLALNINVPEYDTSVSLEGNFNEPAHIKFLTAEVKKFDLTAGPSVVRLLEKLPVKVNDQAFAILRNARRIHLSAKGTADVERNLYAVYGNVESVQGSIEFQAEKGENISGRVKTSAFNLGELLGTNTFGELAFEAEASANTGIGKRWPVGEAFIDFGQLQVKGHTLSGLTLKCTSQGDELWGTVDSTDPFASLHAEGEFEEDNEGVRGSLYADIQRLVPSAFNLLPSYRGHDMSGLLMVEINGNSFKDSEIDLRIEDFLFTDHEMSEVELKELTGFLRHDGEHERRIEIHSDWADIESSITGKNEEIRGIFDFRNIRNAATSLLAQTFPILQLPTEHNSQYAEKADINLHFKADADVYRFWNLPVYPLGDGVVSASLDAGTGDAEFSLNFPYLQQGTNTLIEKTKLSGVLSRDRGTVALSGFTHYPTKKGTLDMDIQILGREGSLFSDIKFLPGAGNLITGNLALNTMLTRNSLTGTLDARVDIVPSVLTIASADWQLGGSTLEWKDGKAYINGLDLKSDKQYIYVSGVASALEDDRVKVRLGGIDLDYVFSILNINYVTFGGIATGEVAASAALSSSPSVSTRFFNVKNFSYNGSRLGDASIRSWFDIPEKMVGIQADITDSGMPAARIDGGIWVTRDSLSFDMDARRINAGFMSPFVSAFATDVRGRASGKLKLFGTFSDIDLTGRAKGDSLSLRLLSTNVVYTGSDSVIMKSGRIEIPSFRVYDRQGHSALLSGWLTHRYFHEPEFDFRLTEASDLLCYDTTEKENQVWYGTIYGSGSGHLLGRPGWVGIDVDMTTDRNSTFTFVLSDKEQAAEYNFLTFTDKRKAAATPAPVDTVPDFLKRFRKRQEQQQGEESTVDIDIRASVTPGVLVTLVMDPETGDKITSRGGGALQMTYNSKSEEMRMYGKYELDQGNYNFNLQDLILKQFTIRPGSSISFNGDPLAANLDIAATYKVNANLTDLDQSFATDPELNRTNVPVDAVLKVHGDLNQPDIDFDIELPTLTADVERKVKSLMSTDDLLSRQIIYLLALNRFYTPENVNMGATGTTGGTELSSVASSTISSHLSNMLSSMTDNLSLSPSFRSDKGDFSDVEVDLGLSSRLLDNRLLINGNLGYRDRNIAGQSTQFIGDFDIEYLLNRSGNLRLKAYNRFNDQNYYLRQALTTQGVGIVVRRDFDNIFSFLRPLRRKQKEKQDSVMTDSLTRK